jgi:type III secretion system PrgH/EprH family protein
MLIGRMVNSMQRTSAAKCVLRVFNGPLQGCEFILAQRRNFFVVGSEVVFCSVERPLTVPEDAIYIPLEFGGCNFEILLEDDGRSGCIVRVLSDDGVIERPMSFQTQESVGGLRVAVRALDEAWQDALLGQLSAVSLEPETSRVFAVRSQLALAGAAFVLLAGLAVVAWHSSRPNPVSNIEALIAGANSSMAVVNGRDRAVYVFADSERDAGWGRQVLVRNGYAATQVLTTYDERARLQGLLATLAPQLAYHHLDLSDPVIPRLLISRQRNLLTTELQSQLENALIAAAPYAREVKIVLADDDELVRLAEEGLQRLALPFTRYTHVDSVTFTVEGSLEDADLQALGGFVVGFNQLWGERYVHFAIELKDDWLNGKSFQYGPQGYVKMTPSSWYFPKPL